MSVMKLKTQNANLCCKKILFSFVLWYNYIGDKMKKRILILLSIFSIYGIVKYFLLDANINKIEFAGYGLILGGVIGNLIDRVFLGYVIDYADFRFDSYLFPVFNLADSAIVIGVSLIIFHLISNAIKQRGKK